MDVGSSRLAIDDWAVAVLAKDGKWLMLCKVGGKVAMLGLGASGRRE